MDEATKLYQICKTVIQMLVDRGYLVTTNEQEIGKEEFKTKYQALPTYVITVIIGVLLFCYCYLLLWVVVLTLLLFTTHTTIHITHITHISD